MLDGRKIIRTDSKSPQGPFIRLAMVLVLLAGQISNVQAEVVVDWVAIDSPGNEPPIRDDGKYV